MAQLHILLQGPYPLFCLLLLTLGLFIWGPLRYDVVAIFALMMAVLIGAVPSHEAFVGLGNPAVITVGAVMIMSSAITRSGVMNQLINAFSGWMRWPTLHVLVLCVLAAFLSAFMNNVGALTLLMPVAIKTAIEHKRSPAMVLMPLAFASALGGLCTLIGTPPNLLISSYRHHLPGGQPFSLFDFAPVGLSVALVGVAFIALLGWRLVPHQDKAPATAEDLFHLQDYMTELSVDEQSPLVDQTVAEFSALKKVGVEVVGLIRNWRSIVRWESEPLQAEDILVVHGMHPDLDVFCQKKKLHCHASRDISGDLLAQSHAELVEAVVPAQSRLVGRSAHGLRLRHRYQSNVLAVSRQSKNFARRLSHVVFRPGDVVLLQGVTDTLSDTIARLNLLPLVTHGIQMGKRHRTWLPLFIFMAAIAVAASGLFPVQIAFVWGLLGLVFTRTLTLRQLYSSVDWSILILLGAMIPLGNALHSTGGTFLIAHYLLMMAGHFSPLWMLALLIIVTMTLSDLLNNAATAVLMAPIAATLAQNLHYHVDPFLMAVAVGASCSFLTPIGHQNNVLVMGPGGYAFGDYKCLSKQSLNGSPLR